MRERKNSQNSNGRSSAGKIAQYGLLIALAFIFSYVEALIPLPVPVPGIKLGLANLVNVVGLYTVGAAGTLVVGLLRIVMGGLYLQQSWQHAVRAGRWYLKPCGYGTGEKDGLV